MPEPEEVAAVLRRAADLIAKRGLAKDRFKDASGRLCVLAATAVAVDADPLLIRATADQRALVEAADLALGTYLCAGVPPRLPDFVVSKWSDATTTTAATAIAGMRAAAEEVRRG